MIRNNLFQGRQLTGIALVFIGVYLMLKSRGKK